MMRIFIAGRLGRDAELRTTPGGEQVLNFSVAVDKRVKGEKVTRWVDCALWGTRGEALAEYLTKGSAVAIEGEADVRAYEKGGETVPVQTCRVSEVTLLGGGQQGDGQAQRSGGERAAPAQRQSAPPSDDGFDDSDIPF